MVSLIVKALFLHAACFLFWYVTLVLLEVGECFVQYLKASFNSLVSLMNVVGILSSHWWIWSLEILCGIRLLYRSHSHCWYVCKLELCCKCIAGFKPVVTDCTQVQYNMLLSWLVYEQLPELWQRKIRGTKQSVPVDIAFVVPSCFVASVQKVPAIPSLVHVKQLYAPVADSSFSHIVDQKTCTVRRHEEPSPSSAQVSDRPEAGSRWHFQEQVCRQVLWWSTQLRRHMCEDRWANQFFHVLVNSTATADEMTFQYLATVTVFHFIHLFIHGTSKVPKQGVTWGVGP